MAQGVLKLHRLKKYFAGTAAINQVSLSLDKGQILCLLGPSGCGKTTLLRLIAGLERPDEGQIFFDGEDILNIPPYRRDFGLMFQEFALFPHKSAGQNVAFGLRMKQETEIERRVEKMLALVGLAGFKDRDVSNLSGGERQRVALARSLAPNPRLLMLDEPLGALDRALRERLMLEIRQILKSVNLTAIYVTHDQTEAFAVADRIVVMNQGRVEQDTSPEQLYHQPATPFVAGFLGFGNLLKGVCVAEDQVETSLGQWSVEIKPYQVGETVTVLIRPEAALLQPAARSIAVEGTLVETLFKGRFYQVMVSILDQQLAFEIAATDLPAVSESIKLWLNPAAILLLPANADNKK